MAGHGQELGGSFALGPWRVRRAGYGAMQLSGDGVFGPPRDRDEALRVLRAAVAAGVDHIDTAQFYGAGTVNELIREALHPYPDDLAIVSKVGVRVSPRTSAPSTSDSTTPLAPSWPSAFPSSRTPDEECREADRQRCRGRGPGPGMHDAAAVGASGQAAHDRTKFVRLVTDIVLALAQQSPDPGDAGSPASPRPCRMDRAAALCTIWINGHLGGTVLTAFPALASRRHGTHTLLTGLLDRSVLYGVLAEIETLGLDLLEVRQLTPDWKSPESGDFRSPLWLITSGVPNPLLREKTVP